MPAANAQACSSVFALRHLKNCARITRSTRVRSSSPPPQALLLGRRFFRGSEGEGERPVWDGGSWDGVGRCGSVRFGEPECARSVPNGGLVRERSSRRTSIGAHILEPLASRSRWSPCRARRRPLLHPPTVRTDRARSGSPRNRNPHRPPRPTIPHPAPALSFSLSPNQKYPSSSSGACGCGEELRPLVNLVIRAQFFKCRRGNTHEQASRSPRVPPRVFLLGHGRIHRPTSGARANRGHAGQSGARGHARCFHGG